MTKVRGDEGRVATDVKSVLNAFRAYDPDIPLQTILVFLTVAERHHTGRRAISLKELASLTGMTPSAISRQTRALSDQHWKLDEDGKPKLGYNLVLRAPDPDDQRETLVTLSVMGERLYRTIKDTLGG